MSFGEPRSDSLGVANPGHLLGDENVQMVGLDLLGTLAMLGGERPQVLPS